MTRPSSFKPALSLLFMICSFAYGQETRSVRDSAALRVDGEVARPLLIHPADLEGMDRLSIKGIDRDGKEHQFSGVRISAILRQAGVPLGSELRGKNMRKYVLSESVDGYKVLYSLAELDSSFSDRLFLLVDREDGQPLPISSGPFRIVVPGEKKHARWAWGVTELIVGEAKE